MTREPSEPAEFAPTWANQDRSGGATVSVGTVVGSVVRARHVSGQIRGVVAVAHPNIEGIFNQIGPACVGWAGACGVPQDAGHGTRS